MASVIEVYKAVQFQIHQTQNGELTYTDFNDQSKLAEIRMLGWLTGKVEEGSQQPAVTPYDNQKNRDWLTPLIVRLPANVEDGKMTRPADYYTFENMYLLTLELQSCEDENEREKIKKKVIELLQGQQFTVRADTDIKLLKPSVKKPIAKQVGNTFEFLPEDLGAVMLEYISYPSKYGKIVTKIDTEFNEEVPDESKCIDYVWGDWAIEILTYFIVQNFSLRVRESALFQMNQATGKQP
jgi:hypothetical protein